VRKGNPKGIKDWGDLIKPGIGVITPKPEDLRRAARWNYLAAWAWAKSQPNGSVCHGQAVTCASSTPMFRCSIPARRDARPRRLSSAASAMCCWPGENEAFLAIKEVGRRQGLQIIVPSLSILAEPSVAVVDQVALKHGTSKIAHRIPAAPVQQEGQEIIAKNFYRPATRKWRSITPSKFPKLKLVDHSRISAAGPRPPKTISRTAQLRPDLRRQVALTYRPGAPAGNPARSRSKGTAGSPRMGLWPYTRVDDAPGSRQLRCDVGTDGGQIHGIRHLPCMISEVDRGPPAGLTHSPRPGR